MLYKSVEKYVHARAQAGQRGATPTVEFVGPVVDALLSDAPPIVLRGGKNSTRLPIMKSSLPTKTFDAKLSHMFGLDKMQP